MNELKARVRGTAPIKPDFLDKYELINRFRMPFVDGGYIDQPALWILEYQTIDTEVQLMELLNELAQPDAQS